MLHCGAAVAPAAQLNAQLPAHIAAQLAACIQQWQTLFIETLTQEHSGAQDEGSQVHEKLMRGIRLKIAKKRKKEKSFDERSQMHEN